MEDSGITVKSEIEEEGSFQMTSHGHWEIVYEVSFSIPAQEPQDENSSLCTKHTSWSFDKEESCTERDSSTHSSLDVAKSQHEEVKEEPLEMKKEETIEYEHEMAELLTGAIKSGTAKPAKWYAVETSSACICEKADVRDKGKGSKGAVPLVSYTAEMSAAESETQDKGNSTDSGEPSQSQSPLTLQISQVCSGEDQVQALLAGNDLHTASSRKRTAAPTKTPSKRRKQCLSNMLRVREEPAEKLPSNTSKRKATRRALDAGGNTNTRRDQVLAAQKRRMNFFLSHAESQTVKGKNDEQSTESAGRKKLQFEDGVINPRSKSLDVIYPHCACECTNEWPGDDDRLKHVFFLHFMDKRLLAFIQLGQPFISFLELRAMDMLPPYSYLHELKKQFKHEFREASAVEMSLLQKMYPNFALDFLSLTLLTPIVLRMAYKEAVQSSPALADLYTAHASSMFYLQRYNHTCPWTIVITPTCELDLPPGLKNDSETAPETRTFRKPRILGPRGKQAVTSPPHKSMTSSVREALQAVIKQFGLEDRVQLYCSCDFTTGKLTKLRESTFPCNIGRMLFLEETWVNCWIRPKGIFLSLRELCCFGLLPACNSIIETMLWNSKYEEDSQVHLTSTEASFVTVRKFRGPQPLDAKNFKKTHIININLLCKIFERLAIEYKHYRAHANSTFFIKLIGDTCPEGNKELKSLYQATHLPMKSTLSTQTEGICKNAGERAVKMPPRSTCVALSASNCNEVGNCVPPVELEATMRYGHEKAPVLSEVALTYIYNPKHKEEPASPSKGRCSSSVSTANMMYENSKEKPREAELKSLCQATHLPMKSSISTQAEELCENAGDRAVKMPPRSTCVALSASNCNEVDNCVPPMELEVTMRYGHEKAPALSEVALTYIYNPKHKEEPASPSKGHCSSSVSTANMMYEYSKEKAREAALDLEMSTVAAVQESIKACNWMEKMIHLPPFRKEDYPRACACKSPPSPFQRYSFHACHFRMQAKGVSVFKQLSSAVLLPGRLNMVLYTVWKDNRCYFNVGELLEKGFLSKDFDYSKIALLDYPSWFQPDGLSVWQLLERLNINWRILPDSSSAFMNAELLCHLTPAAGLKVQSLDQSDIHLLQLGHVCRDPSSVAYMLANTSLQKGRSSESSSSTSDSCAASAFRIEDGSVVPNKGVKPADFWKNQSPSKAFLESSVDCQAEEGDSIALRVIPCSTPLDLCQLRMVLNLSADFFVYTPDMHATSSGDASLSALMNTISSKIQCAVTERGLFCCQEDLMFEGKFVRRTNERVSGAMTKASPLETNEIFLKEALGEDANKYWVVLIGTLTFKTQDSESRTVAALKVGDDIYINWSTVVTVVKTARIVFSQCCLRNAHVFLLPKALNTHPLIGSFTNLPVLPNPMQNVWIRVSVLHDIYNNPIPENRAHLLSKVSARIRQLFIEQTPEGNFKEFVLIRKENTPCSDGKA